MPEIESSMPASPNFEKLKAKLRELFELDKADLDFGIYRVLRQRHTEIAEFLDKHLEKTVRAALTTHGDLQNVQFKHELEKAEAAAAGAGIVPEQSPRVMELRDKLAKGADLEATADEVYSHLLTFFSRYYQAGDFLGLHRSTVHGREKYMIPYNGEEVKLVWANMDQYYIKSSELLRDYTFRIRKADLATGELNLNDLPAESVVRFKLVEGDTEKDNRKSDGKTTRAFALDADEPFQQENETTLRVRFRYREHTSERNLQDKLNADTEKALADNLPPRWKALLFATDPTHQPKDKKDTRTVLQKHLRGYTAKYLFDYFIHKDLGGFLRRELDFYVKNEVMHLDDIEDTTAPKAEEYISKIRAIRRCALPVIQMIAQLEEFQKKLWLKKKFVVETRYCLTLDRAPETLYPDICTADAQWQEWDELVALSELKPKRTPEFLKAHPYLMIDTRHFPREFTLKLLASIENIDASLDGVCFHSENFQALQLMQERYHEDVKCVYIDPPYNTPHSQIIYKNNFLHSTWLTLVGQTLHLIPPLWKKPASFGFAIDDFEQANLARLLDCTFPNLERSTIVVNHHPQGAGGRLSRTHEYYMILSDADGPPLRGEPKKETDEDRTFMRSGTGDNNWRAPREGGLGRWKSFYALLYDRATDKIVGAEDPPALGAKYPTEPTPEGFERIYPINSRGEERVWRASIETGRSKAQAGELIRSERGSVYQQLDHTGKRETLFSNWTEPMFNAGMQGSNILSDLGLGGKFDYPKSLYTNTTGLWAQTFGDEKAIVLDYFGGSGTTAHAVIYMNRSDSGQRKYLLAEMGDHAEKVIFPRLKKVVYSTDWEEGKPQNRDSGISHAFKIVRLESYEDTLNNLRLNRAPEQETALTNSSQTVRDQYLLGYFLDVESAGSRSLLDLAEFRDPFAYKLAIATSSAGESKETTVDLVETFNWLLGLKVKHIDTAKGFLTVTGEKRAGGRCLILWRTLSADPKADNEALEKFLTKLAVNPTDTEFDFLYVNGPHTLNDPHNKVHIIEEAFQRLMFDTTNFESLN